jgi:transposase, IS6 family
MKRCRRLPGDVVPRSAFRGFRFRAEVIVLAVRWYLRYGLSYREVEELLAERGAEVDHVTLYRWVQRFTPLLADAAAPARHAVGARWFVERPTSKSAASRGTSIGPSTSTVRSSTSTCQRGAISPRRGGSPRGCSTPTVNPTKVMTDKAPALARAIADLFASTLHDTARPSDLISPPPRST